MLAASYDGWYGGGGGVACGVGAQGSRTCPGHDVPRAIAAERHLFRWRKDPNFAVKALCGQRFHLPRAVVAE
jgi:hypothetical protein